MSAFGVAPPATRDMTTRNALVVPVCTSVYTTSRSHNMAFNFASISRLSFMDLNRRLS